MKTIVVTHTIAAPIEQVFAELTDHANYKQFRGIKDSKLIREGHAEKNGVGARRLVVSGPMKIVEDIVAYDAPNSFQYQIVKLMPPAFDHVLGLVELEENDGKTTVTWTSKIRNRIPVVGKFIEKQVFNQGNAGFKSILKTIEKKLTAQVAA